MGRKWFPVFCKALQVGVDALRKCLPAEFVGFREHNAEGDAAFSEPLHELKVNLLGLMAAVEQNEEVGEAVALEDVAGDYLFQLGTFGLAPLGKTVAREVNEVP